MDNPRGRMSLLCGVATERIGPDGAFQRHIDRCLGCLACAPSCPSGVEFADLLESARQVASEVRRRGPLERFLRGLAMRQLLPHLGRLRFLALLVTLYQAVGLQALVRRLSILPKPLQAVEALLPAWPLRPRTRASGSEDTRGRVGLFIGCVQEAFLGQVNQATVRVLEHNGYEVVIPPGQTCCAALHIHDEEWALAADLARKNIDAFLDADVEAIVVNAGGCGAALKEYPRLFDRGEYAVRARVFQDRLRDVSEFLVERGVETPQGHLDVRATYADSCHLRNVQGVVQQPRDLLRSIPGLDYVELDHPEHCCGSAGIYNIVHPEISQRLLEAKIADIADTEADVVVVTNPGCQMQIASGVRGANLDVRVLHLVELLDEAYAAEEGGELC
jgi:glycolate oxidase iron-sulfur subunit